MFTTCQCSLGITLEVENTGKKKTPSQEESFKREAGEEKGSQSKKEMERHRRKGSCVCKCAYMNV